MPATAPPPSNTAAQPADTTADGTAAPPRPDRSGNNDDGWLGWLKTSHLIVGIIGVILGGILLNLVKIGELLWAALRFFLFALLKSPKGSAELMKLIAEQVQLKPELLMTIILGELKKNPADLMTLAVTYFQATGRKEFRELLLLSLGSPEAEEQMTKLVARLTAQREIARENVDVARKVSKPRRRDVEKLERALEEIGMGGMGEGLIVDPVELEKTLERLKAGIVAGVTQSRNKR